MSVKCTLGNYLTASLADGPLASEGFVVAFWFKAHSKHQSQTAVSTAATILDIVTSNPGVTLSPVDRTRATFAAASGIANGCWVTISGATGLSPDINGDYFVGKANLNGRTYGWCNVPQRIYDGWKGSASKGAYFNRAIKGQFDC